MNPWREGKTVVLGVAAGAQIREGQMVALNAGGFLVSATDASAAFLVGQANQIALNVNGTNGEETIAVKRDGAFLFGNSAGADEIKPTRLFEDCYLVNGDTVAATDGGTGRIIAGKVIEISDEGVWVEVNA